MRTPEQVRKYNKTQYQKYIDAGLCPRCGKNPHEPEKKLCQNCVEYTTRSVTERLARRRLAGFCMCGELPAEGMKLCLKCQYRSREGNRKSVVRSNYHRDKLIALRAKVFEGYGNKCNCLGCTVEEPWFLQIDHVFNNGAAHKRAIGDGLPMYKWIIENNYPDSIQLLCANCNWSKGIYGVCPHEVQRIVRERNKR